MLKRQSARWVNSLALLIAASAIPAYATDLALTIRSDGNRITLKDAFVHYGAFTGDERKGVLVRTDAKGTANNMNLAVVYKIAGDSEASSGC